MRTRLTLAGTLVFLLFFISSAVCSANGTVPAPTKAELAADLIGRKLSEGTDKGYFPSDWYWTIEEGEICGLKILSESVSDNYCSYVVTMTLQKQSSPTKYEADVQMDYSFLKKKWQLILVKSKGVRIVKTDKYLDCISTSIDTHKFCVKNNVDIPLIVGGVAFDFKSQVWEKFSTVVNGMCSNTIYERSGCRIHFVEPL